MKDLLVTIFALTLILLADATKKEDLERAAELAVERAAERVAERAVEKALESGNSTTTTVTVREGYSNARKVAEEQAAPGSESTRYHQEANDYQESDYQSEQYPESEYDDPNKTRDDDIDFDWNEGDPENGNYGLKENAQMETKKSDYEDRDDVEDDEEMDENDEEQDNEAWKAYSNWENGFKQPEHDNWSPSKSFWSAEDFSFWDMDDAETKNSRRNVQRVLNATEPVTEGSETHVWKSKDFPPIEWKMKRTFLSRADDSNSRSYRVPEVYTFREDQEFWPNKESPKKSSWANSDNVEGNSWKAETLAEGSDWEDVETKEVADDGSWGDQEDFQMDSWDDAEIPEGESWSNKAADENNRWNEEQDYNSNSRLDKEYSDPMIDFWANKGANDYPTDDSWESKQTSDDGKINQEYVSTENPEEDTEASTEVLDTDSNAYTTPWTPDGSEYGSPETDTSAVITKRSTFYEQNNNNNNNNNNQLKSEMNYSLDFDNVNYKLTPLPLINTNIKDLFIPSSYDVNDSPYLDHRFYRPVNKNVNNDQATLMKTTYKRRKIKPILMESYNHYPLETYNPYLAAYERYLNQLRFPYRQRLQRTKKHPLYHQRNSILTPSNSLKGSVANM